MHSRACTAYGLSRAALSALGINEAEYSYYAPDEEVKRAMDYYNVSRSRIITIHAMIAEGVFIYPCAYIRSAGAYKRSYRPLTLDWDTNEFYC